MTLLPASKSNRAVFLAVILCLVWLYGNAILSGTFGHMAGEPDNVMRYIQIRDWMNGQSWFDTDQYRLGVATGTDMHWSRLPDVPVAVLAWFFGIFTTQEQALFLAAAIWPPLLGAVLLVILTRGAERLSTAETRLPAVLAVLAIGLVFTGRSIRFESGALDHHNLQVVLMMGCVVALLTASRLKSGLLAGALMGAALAIGPEVYPFIALIGLFVALDWAWLGQARAKRTLGFGLGFALSLAALFLLTVAPSDWTKNYCDQLSTVNVLAGIIGGSGLALAAWKMSSQPLWMRILPLGAIGLAVLALVGAIAPQCFSNPLDALPETMHKFWLDHISEAKPLGVDEPLPLREIPFFIGTAIVIITVLIWNLIKRGSSSVTYLFLMLLVASLALTVYQVRFFIFLHVFAIVPSAIWIANTYVAGTKKKSNIAYLGATVLSLPIFMTVPHVLLSLNSDQASEAKTASSVACSAPDVIEALNKLPTGVVQASPSHGADLMKVTEHRYLAANYHRNIAGIQADIDIQTASVDRAKQLIKKYGVDYILLCETDHLTEFYGKDYPNAFAVKLETGETPTWLSLENASLSDGGVKLYRVLK